MMNDSEILQTLQTGIPDVRAVYRFGSYGSEFERSDSDMDLAVLAQRPCGVVELWNLREKLAGNLNREVDLVDLHRASTVLRAQIVAFGTRLFCADHIECDTYENYALAAYARLNEERKVILEDVSHRGSIYGR